MAGALGLLCALVLGVVFYGTMVYQLTGSEEEEIARQDLQGKSLALSGCTLLSEKTEQVEMGGEICTVLTRVYAAQDGAQVKAITASPAAYLEALSQEGFAAQLITGFTLYGLDAVYETRGDEGVLAARSGDTVFMLRAQATEQQMYAYGASAVVE